MTERKLIVCLGSCYKTRRDFQNSTKWVIGISPLSITVLINYFSMAPLASKHESALKRKL